MNERVSRSFERRSVLDPTFSPDGSKLLYFTARDGGTEKTVFVSSGNDETPVRIASSRILDHGWQDSERLWWIDEQLVYTAYNTATEETRQVDLYPASDRAVSGEFLADRSVDRSATIIRNSEGDSLVVNRAESSEPYEVVYQPRKYTSLCDWHPSEDRLLVRESLSTIDHRVLIIDCERARHRTFSLERRGARFGSLQWGPAGEQIYCVTDAHRDSLYGATIEPESMDITPIVTDDRWNIEGIDVTASGKLLYVVNEDGKSIVYVCRLTDDGTEGARRIDGLPAGVTKQGDFSPRGDRVALAHSTESTPARLYVYDWRSDSTTRWQSIARPKSQPVTRAGRSSESVRYESTDSRKIPALLFEPRDGRERKGVIVDVHGGPERQRRPQYRPMRELFRSLGFAVLEPNIRGSTGYGRWYTTLDDCNRRFDAVDDVAAAGRWLRSSAGLEADHVLLSGTSYGGFMALINSYRYGELWDGAISISGIYDLEDFMANLQSHVRYLREQEYGTPELTAAVFDELSPLCAAERISIPILVAHGTADQQVPPDGARALVDRAADDGTPARLLLYEDEGHRITDPENRADLYDTIAAFLEGISR